MYDPFQRKGREEGCSRPTVNKGLALLLSREKGKVEEFSCR
jgi:hypothetical protein